MTFNPMWRGIEFDVEMIANQSLGYPCGLEQHLETNNILLARNLQVQLAQLDVLERMARYFIGTDDQEGNSGHRTT